MSQYKDISSYKLAIKLRTPKTVLVEGITDKLVLSRFLMGRNHSENNLSNFLIDDVSIIGNDATLSGLGNRDRVLAVATELNNDQDKINFLVDREWHNIDINAVTKTCFEQNNQTALFTKGHSIENYWFDPLALSNFLILEHAQSIKNEFLTELKNRFEEFLRFSASYSIAVKDASALTKCGGMISADDIEWNGQSYKPKATIVNKSQQRGIADDICQLMENNRQQIEAIQPDLLQWICHGHLGEEAIRSCAANLAFEFGINENTARCIERGKHREKLQHDAIYMTDYDLTKLEPLGDLLRWVRNEQTQ